MFWSWFAPRHIETGALAHLPESIRNEVLSICRADALRLQDVAKAPRPDCGCLDDTPKIHFGR